MGQDWITARVVLPHDGNNGEHEPDEVRFAALPRPGDWLDWGAVSRRVFAVSWYGGGDNAVQMPHIWLEYAPLEDHPRRSPARRRRLQPPKKGLNESD